MKINIKKHLLAILAVPAFVLSISSAPVFAEEIGSIQDGADSAQSEEVPTSLFAEGGAFETVSKVLLFVIGAISVIMLIIGGIRYTISQGDSSQVTSAKNTILYSIVGLVVAILAYAAVDFVIGSLLEQQ